MVARPLCWSVAALGYVVTAIYAHAATVELRPDVDQLAEGQSAGLSVVVTDGQPITVPQPVAPKGLRITYTGQSRNRAINNGVVLSFFKFRYELTALEAGTYTLGPVPVQLQGASGPQTLQSNAAVIKVDPRPADLPGPVSPVQIENGFSVETAWVGQVVLYHDTIRARLEVVGSRWHNRPQDGLTIPQDARPTRNEYVVQDAAGALYVDETHVPFQLVAAGPLAFEAPLVELDVATSRGGGGLFGLLRRTETTVAQGSPMTLQVQALPPPPEGYSGLVGEFELHNRIDLAGARVGASIPWTIELAGDGTLQGFKLPALPEAEGVRIYDGTPQSASTIQRDAFYASGSYPRTVVPTREGKVSLPAFEIITFSPALGSYATLRVPQQELWVAAGEQGEVDLQSFGPDGPALDATPAEDLGVRPLWRQGQDRRLPLERGALQALIVLFALPSLVLLAAVAREQLQRRRAAAAQTERPVTPADLLAALPTEREPRLAAFDGALRLALERAGAAAEPLSEAVGALRHEIDLARFADRAPPADLEARVRDLITKLESA